MSARTVVETLTVGEVLCFVQDVLSQAADRDAALVALMEGKVFPLHEGERYSLRGRVGTVRRGRFPDSQWQWQVEAGAYHAPIPDPRGWPRGMARSEREADAALCRILQNLGWFCLEAP